ncbi:hypothetical protein [Sphingomonas sp. G-3-2-10]|uniref:hypothetical protein n=1 Tax=Sphingomonas sp. G-3-2-10 TaxID=2728838 RepID=UPI00146EBC1C|nr:hypothetical protein [Sphingomonas sp. G-3-2-10]NML07305.1 hypothetical protein [Sphingomonas sp. G-3-2-10]
MSKRPDPEGFARATGLSDPATLADPAPAPASANALVVTEDPDDAPPDPTPPPTIAGSPSAAVRACARGRRQGA